MHNNLFSAGHSRAEIKNALNDQQKRGHSVLQVLDFVAGGSLIYLLRNQPIIDAIVAFVAIFAALSGLRCFVDQSVRNFYLHRLDWEETTHEVD
jgi:hypothetical protein